MRIHCATKFSALSVWTCLRIWADISIIQMHFQLFVIDLFNSLVYRPNLRNSLCQRFRKRCRASTPRVELFGFHVFCLERDDERFCSETWLRILAPVSHQLQPVAACFRKCVIASISHTDWLLFSLFLFLFFFVFQETMKIALPLLILQLLLAPALSVSSHKILQTRERAGVEAWFCAACFTCRLTAAAVKIHARGL